MYAAISFSTFHFSIAWKNLKEEGNERKKSERRAGAVR